MYSFWRKITTISANYKGGAFGYDRVEDGLDKVFCIVLKTKSIHLKHIYIYERSKLPPVGIPSTYALQSKSVKAMNFQVSANRFMSPYGLGF